MYAALHGRGGDYLSNSRPVSVTSLASDKDAQEQLFKYSNKVLGITNFGGFIWLVVFYSLCGFGCKKVCCL